MTIAFYPSIDTTSIYHMRFILLLSARHPYCSGTHKPRLSWELTCCQLLHHSGLLKNFCEWYLNCKCIASSVFPYVKTNTQPKSKKTKTHKPPNTKTSKKPCQNIWKSCIYFNNYHVESKFVLQHLNSANCTSVFRKATPVTDQGDTDGSTRYQQYTIYIPNPYGRELWRVEMHFYLHRLSRWRFQTSFQTDTIKVFHWRMSGAFTTCVFQSFYEQSRISDHL